MFLIVNIILIIGHEKLTVDIQKLYGLDNEDMLILKVPKSGGVIFPCTYALITVLNLQAPRLMR